LRLADHVGAFLAAAADDDLRIWVIDGDLADSDGAVHFARRHPDRFVMAGIAEQAMVSTACGLASCGVRPWVFSFAAFLCFRAYDQIRVGLGHAGYPVALVASHSGGCSGRNGKSHAALNDLSLMTSLPGVRVMAPAGPADVALCCRALLAGDAPGYLRLPRRALEDLPGCSEPVRWVGRPSPIALAGHGLGAHLAMAARRLLGEQGTNVGLLNFVEISPLPASTMELMAQVHTLFVVEDHYAAGGLATLLAAAFPRVRVTGVGWPSDWPGESGEDETVQEQGGMAPASIVARILASSGRSSRA
jgi:transketolase